MGGLGNSGVPLWRWPPLVLCLQAMAVPQDVWDQLIGHLRGMELSKAARHDASGERIVQC